MRAVHAAALGALCVLALSGCAAARVAEPVAVVNPEVISRPFDAVWSQLVAHLAARHIHIQTLSKADGFIDTAFQALPEDALHAYARMNGASGVSTRARAKANIFIRELGEHRVEVTVIPRVQVFEQRVSRHFRGGWRQADSTGKFEAEILDIVRLIAESGPRADRPLRDQHRDISK